MTSPRAHRSKFYDGAVYGRVVDPMLAGVHGYVAAHLPPGPRVLDACCGTGALARKLATRGRRVLGVDLSPRNIEYARRRSDRFEPEQLEFEVADVSQLTPPPQGRYDVATIVLAIHEMPPSARVDVLRSLLRVARRVMIVDFAAPMRWSIARVRNWAMEIAAGREHFAAFRSYTRAGGLPPLLAHAGADIESERHIDAATLHVVVARGLH